MNHIDKYGKIDSFSFFRCSESEAKLRIVARERKKDEQTIWLPKSDFFFVLQLPSLKR